MNCAIHSVLSGKIVYISEGILESDQDALDLVAVCGENKTRCILIHSEFLPKEFYDLKSGLAGSILLKFSNYHLKVAAIIPVENIGQGRFAEFALETRRSQDFRIFQQETDAINWLLDGYIDE